MKRILVCIVFCAVSFSGFSQKNLVPKKNQDSIPNTPDDQEAYMISGGYFQQNFSLLNNYIHQFGNSPGFTPFFQTVGFDFVLPMGTQNREWKASVNAEMVVPQQVVENDSVKFRMNGWHFITGIYNYDLLRENKKLALEIVPGIDWGELYLKATDQNGLRIYHNPIIAPMVRTEFRVVLQPFAFGIRTSYRYDVTNPRWKSDTDNASAVDSRISGLIVQVFVGWGKIVVHKEE